MREKQIMCVVNIVSFSRWDSAHCLQGMTLALVELRISITLSYPGAQFPLFSSFSFSIPEFFVLHFPVSRSQSFRLQ